VNGQECAEITLGYADGATKPMGDKLAGGDPAANCTRRDAEHFRRLSDAEELDRVAPTSGTVAFQTTNICATATRAASPPGHYPHSSDLAAASRRATYAFMLATVILRERPSL
jgi:hypothetical protein